MRDGHFLEPSARAAKFLREISGYVSREKLDADFDQVASYRSRRWRGLLHT